jgi:hypothetical protein
MHSVDAAQAAKPSVHRVQAAVKEALLPLHF